MLKPLIKKQFIETTAFFFTGKNGKRRSPLAILGFVALMVYAFGVVGAMFYLMADTLCAPLVGAGLGWVYFALVGTLATAFAVIGSVFTAKAKLYEAKDNDFLLSLPIKPWEILFSRAVSLYAFAFLFGALVFIPATVCYFIVAGVQVLSLVFITLTVLILPLGAVALSAILGWLFALLTSKIKAKNAVTFLLTFAFMALYFWGYSKINEYLSYLIANGEAVGAKIKTVLFVFWQMGLGATGNAGGFFAFAGIFLAIFALVAFLIDRSFLSIITTKRSGTKNKYKEKSVKSASAFSALVRRECMRLFKNAMILLNTTIGSLFLIAMPVVLAFNRDFVSVIAGLDEFAMIIALLVAAMGGMNTITSSSVSLEGKNISTLRALPVSPWQLLLAKLAVYALLAVLPAFVCVVALCTIFQISFGVACLACVGVLALTVLFGASGLIINLKLPTFDWTSEIVAVKQSASTLVSMFLNIGISALFVGAYFLFGKYLPVGGFLGICAGALAIVDTALLVWLKMRGTEIFSKFH